MPSSCDIPHIVLSFGVASKPGVTRSMTGALPRETPTDDGAAALEQEL